MDYYSAIIKRLERLVAMDTTISAANELLAAYFLKAEFKQNNIDGKIFEPRRNRGSFYAQLDGKNPRKILLLTHLDTEEFKKGSPGRLVKKKDIYFGRGTLDCKGLIAVWSQVIFDLYRQFGKPEYTLAFAAAADEECNGRYGTEWLMEHTECFDDVKLVIGEGGGYAVHYKDRTYFTFQTGELEDKIQGTAQDNFPVVPERVIRHGIQKGYYNEKTLDYFLDWGNPQSGRCVSRESFYEGIESYIGNKKRTEVLEKYAPVFEETLQEFDPDYELLPVISPGYSDNRFFRRQGIDTIGFFPIEPGNYLGGIHGEYECITETAIEFAYGYCKKLLKKIIYKKD